MVLPIVVLVLVLRLVVLLTSLCRSKTKRPRRKPRPYYLADNKIKNTVKPVSPFPMERTGEGRCPSTEKLNFVARYGAFCV